MTKRYFLKYNVASGTIVLDQSKIKKHYDELLVLPNRITKSQGKRLKDRITDRFLYRDRKAFINEVEYEFKEIFNICTGCGFVTDKDKTNKAWGRLCSQCFREEQANTRRRNQAAKDERRQLRRYRLHLQTIQGQIDAIPMEIIESNVRFEMRRQGKTMKNVAEAIGISNSAMSRLLKNKFIDKDELQLISEYLFVPLEKFLRVPRGVRIPKTIDDIPKFWLEDGFRIRKY